MSRHTTRVRASNDRASLYTEITDKIIAELEAGRIPWSSHGGRRQSRRHSQCRATLPRCADTPGSTC
jgi:antirestriction protein ArdC